MVPVAAAMQEPLLQHDDGNFVGFYEDILRGINNVQ
jgi:hypothetical protein